MGEDGKYALCQEQIVNIFQNVWGESSMDLSPHPNDRCRVFGIMMTKPEFHEHYQRLCDGVCNCCNQYYDVAYSNEKLRKV